MTPPRSILGAAAAALAAAALTAATPLRSHAATSCSNSEGDILAYLPTAGKSCGALSVGVFVYRNETLHSGTTGTLSFETRHIYRCIELADVHGSADRVYPKAGIAIRHLRGTTWCLHLTTDRAKTLTSPGAVIHLEGTLLGIHSNRRGSIVKVDAGKARVASTATRKTVTVQAGFQAFLPAHGAPQKPKPLMLSGQDNLGVFRLSDNVLAMGALSQAGQYLNLKKQSSALIIAQDLATGENATAALDNTYGIKTDAITADQASNPKLVLAYAKRIKATTVIVIGSAATMQPIARTIATKLPPAYTVLTVFTK